MPEWLSLRYSYYDDFKLEIIGSSDNLTSASSSFDSDRISEMHTKEDQFERVMFFIGMRICGHSVVGKTSLITRFMYDSFDNTYQVWNIYIYWIHINIEVL